MRPILTVMAVAATTSAAFASGGLSCEVKDKNAQIAVSSGVTRGMGAPIFNFSGRIEIRGKSVPQDLRKTQFGDDHVAQYWLDGKELRLLLYRERDADRPHGYVQVTITTRARGDEGTYDGRYSLAVYDTSGNASAEGKTVELSGKIGCFVE